MKTGGSDAQFVLHNSLETPEVNCSAALRLVQVISAAASTEEDDAVVWFDNPDPNVPVPVSTLNLQVPVASESEARVIQ